MLARHAHAHVPAFCCPAPIPPDQIAWMRRDFAYLEKSDSVIVIELSPFLTCTGAAMFNWK